MPSVGVQQKYSQKQRVYCQFCLFFTVSGSPRYHDRFALLQSIDASSGLDLLELMPLMFPQYPPAKSYTKIYGLICALLKQEYRNNANGALKVKHFRRFGGQGADMPIAISPPHPRPWRVGICQPGLPPTTPLHICPLLCTDVADVALPSSCHRQNPISRNEFPRPIRR